MLIRLLHSRFLVWSRNAPPWGGALCDDTKNGCARLMFILLKFMLTVVHTGNNPIINNVP